MTSPAVEEAARLDQDDELKHVRERFIVPPETNYLDGARSLCAVLSSYSRIGCSVMHSNMHSNQHSKASPTDIVLAANR